ncbi:hypothetical protein NOVOSPHI9U_130012 [Novosphingobium sp. 9U]|nr:hypothetical protein NOVOSPHI9U_130012 [Novosphingobium sp. 9U]
MEKASYLDFIIEVIRRSDKQEGFKVLPRRGSSSGHLAG